APRRSVIAQGGRGAGVEERPAELAVVADLQRAGVAARLARAARREQAPRPGGVAVGARLAERELDPPRRRLVAGLQRRPVAAPLPGRTGRRQAGALRLARAQRGART